MSDQPNGSVANGSGIVPAGPGLEGNEGRPTPLVLGSVLFCALGGFVATTSLAFLAPAMIAFGLFSSATRGQLREMLPGLLAALAVIVALNASSGAVAIADGVIACAASLAVSLALLRGKLGPGVSCILVAALTAAHLGVDAVATTVGGTTLADLVSQVLAYVRQQLVEASPTAAAQVDSTVAMLEVMWPTGYVVAALAEGLMAQLGAWLAAAGRPEVSRPRLADFDLPLWIVAALVASVAGLAAALTVPAAPDVLLMVSANAVMALRFALLAQGMGVLSWFLEERRVGPLGRVLAAVAGFYLEAQFIVVSIVGLVDVWANFRHLARGGQPGPTGNAEQDKEPANAG